MEPTSVNAIDTVVRADVPVGLQLLGVSLFQLSSSNSPILVRSLASAAFCFSLGKNFNVASIYPGASLLHASLISCRRLFCFLLLALFFHVLSAFCPLSRFITTLAEPTAYAAAHASHAQLMRHFTLLHLLRASILPTVHTLRARRGRHV